MPEEVTALSKAEVAMLKKIADRDGVSIEEAASRLGSEALARRVRKKTGKGPARVVAMKGRK